MSFRSLTVRLLAPGALLVTAACVGATDATVATGAAAPSSTVTTTTIAVPACVAALSVEQKAGQLLMVLVPTPAAAGDLVAAGRVAGYALVGAQTGDVTAEVAAVAARSKLPVFASGDEEGGTVQRFRDMLGALPSAAALARDNSPEKAAQIFGQYGAKLRALCPVYRDGKSMGELVGLRERHRDDPPVVESQLEQLIDRVNPADMRQIAVEDL